jgi:RNA recognition motif-containing protein
MQTDEAAQQAINAMHDKDCGGRPLTVNEAKPREAGGGNRGGGRRF